MQTVVGGLIIDQSTVLAARRRAGALAGLWEFPGGKVEPGETPEDALRRELHEELALEVEVGAELSAPGGAWPISEAYELRLFLARIVTGTPGPGPDHDAVRWLAADQLADVEWLPSDTQALPAVRRLIGGPSRPT
ncbi:8-oxo-dGTP diphosphatase [Nocardioides thalensis]|uniref:8-oxo-dGTP diphosphatase n=1 Tax=Nocardioides thalensis TaxID=1914755 RepID=A0A853BY60_9ACTN|nr:8-oxo-dGTP diphosphatase [Nocardioides thalensis]